VRVVLDQSSTNVLWPLPGNRYRWTFQLLKSEMAMSSRQRATGGTVAQTVVDESIRQYVEKVAKRRAPWFTAGVKEIAWCTEVVFEQRSPSSLARAAAGWRAMPPIKRPGGGPKHECCMEKL